ncbi:MAG: hypothetical protein IH626_06860 [Rhodospirillales bacterium]|nr:hypothetical protein [Rhodospirillales bacterium]
MTKKSLAEIAACLEKNSVHRMLRAINDSPTLKALEAYHRSPAFQALEAYRASPAFQAMEAFQNSAAFKAMELARQSVIAHPEILSIQAKLAETQRSLLGDPSWLHAQAQMAEMRKTMMATMASGRIAFDALDSVNKLLATGVISRNLVDAANTSFSAVARANQWASSLANIPVAKLRELYPGLAAVANSDDIHKMARAISAASGGVTLSAALGLTAGLDVELERTRLKLSAFVGAREIHGFDAAITSAAYKHVFGEWRTQPDLPQRFWRDPKVRWRMYEEAEVDAGLVEAEPSTALEVVVESGLAGGFRGENGTIAVVSVGAFSMSIRSRDTRVDAYKVLGVFEEQLRAFISHKLKEKVGPRWFKQRIDGMIGGKAKATRETAVRHGEAPMSLVHYTDLGDLRSIVLAKNNWSEVFESAFINREHFDHDMQKLIAARRPTAHYRKLDGVRLVELICVIDRLTKWMGNDGGWKDIIESDE